MKVRICTFDIRVNDHVFIKSSYYQGFCKGNKKDLTWNIESSGLHILAVSIHVLLYSCSNVLIVEHIYHLRLFIVI